MRVARVPLVFLCFSVGGRVIADQLHNERETKSETGSKCLCRSDNGINGRLLRERLTAIVTRMAELYRVAGIVHVPLCTVLKVRRTPRTISGPRAFLSSHFWNARSPPPYRSPSVCVCVCVFLV